ncbi:membrane protein insertion efficiency factor YidD [Pseudactinotalea terrae]|uniref:membrane protein insertion efficiency factor YidD n=1 Tax=Pseudactinotalea terrae TaxID=1743262 RepID=UPI001F4F3161|nr:membrane protein insertion efficiency factor YidD [Pseudactinotalea terrae]
MSDEPRPGIAARLLAGAVRGYQLIVSPWFAPRCRYYPSCSAYAIGALRTHGAIRGTGLAVWRVLRCNPWSLGGVDHVPPRHDKAEMHHHTTEGTAKGRTLGGRTSRGAQA